MAKSCTLTVGEWQQITHTVNIRDARSPHAKMSIVGCGVDSTHNDDKKSCGPESTTRAFVVECQKGKLRWAEVLAQGTH
jgi:hypothetical protein